MGYSDLTLNSTVLYHVLNYLPGHVYWKDLNGVYLGCNESQAKSLGFSSSSHVIGKDDFELQKDPKIAQEYRENDIKVMESGDILVNEEKVTIDGKEGYVISQKMPLKDNFNQLIGVIGISFDITTQKEAEILKLENESRNIQLEQQKKFFDVSKQVAHDIRSPLASLLMIVRSCTDIPEAERIALREAAMGIEDIANNLLNKYVNKPTEAVSNNEERKPKLVSAVLLQIITDKKFQYKDLPIKFISDFADSSHFSFIKIAPSSFRRMLSNLINNAVDAINKSEAKVTVKLSSNNEWVYIKIIDNGKGMSPELINKIMQREAVTHGKESGHGIGLIQVHETLDQNQGELSINSIKNQQTTITLKFPRIKAPNWVAEEIKLLSDDLVIILDDDPSIHGAWESRFEKIIQNNPNITLKHFQVGGEALTFINSLSEAEKNKLFLLTDYELLKQELNGLHVIGKSGVKRSVLVTSHYADPIVRERAEKVGTKILPKQLAPEVSIYIDNQDKTKAHQHQVDLVIVDDDPSYVQNLEDYILPDKVIDKYHDPRKFLENIDKYSKDTLIILDHNIGSGYNGIEIAKELNSKGYNNLYLLTGDVLNQSEIPEYLTVINKIDLNSIGNLC